jgi:hypothetical protein
MSVQLIVYPQNYEGGYNEISSSPTEFIVNGLNFANMSTANSYDSNTSSLGATSMVDTLINQPPLVNAWQRFRTTSTGTPTLPTSTAGNLVLSAASTSTSSGVYQKLTNLTIGQNYTLTINSASIPAGKYQIGVFNSNNSISIWSTNNIPSTSFNITYTASDTAMTFFISYQNTSATTWTINDISVQPVIGAVPSGATNVLEDGQVICDLYEDEDIPLSLSVDDFKNVAEKVQSYSKAFNLPATKRNNRIFDNIFEITRSDDGVIFNPYKKTKCVLKQDGFILFEGYLRMLDVTEKEGEISYNVNLYSEVVALADVLGDRAFRDLDFTELEHDYNKSEIKHSWNDGVTAGQLTPITWANPSTSGFRTDFSTLKYPFVDWTHQIAVGGSNNNSATVGNPELLTLEAAFRPFISIKYLIDRIFEATPFTYESEFFDTDDFKKLYMDFNWGADNTPAQAVSNNTNTFYCNGGQGTHYAGTTYTNFVLDNTGLAFFTFPPNYDSSTNIITATNDNETYTINYRYRMTNTDTVTRTVEARYFKNSTEFNYSGVITIAAGASHLFQGNLAISLDTGDTLQAQFKSSSAGVVQQAIAGSTSFTFGTNVTYILGVTNITTDLILQTLRGELGQWDFLKGLMTMFNLVSLPDEDNPNNIIFESYSDVFIPTATAGNTLADRGIQHDWTEKIDVSEMKLTPLADLNKKTIFKFVEDDDDYSFNQYKNLVGGHLYGSKKYDAWNEFNILVGEDEIVAEPFAATLVKPLMSQFSDFITPAVYARGSDDTWEGFDNSPRIMYNNGIKSTGADYYIPAQNGLYGEHQANFLQFSHLSDVPTILATPSVAGSLDFHFGECQLMTGVGAPVPDNLFNLYWLPYYSELYNPNTRIMTIKVNLSPADINTFKFNDTVYLKNRVFRVNKIDYKPNDLATVEFILIP